MKNNNAKKVFVIFILCCFCLPFQAHAWFDSGHMLIAETAYRYLDKKTKAEVDFLVSQLGDAPPSYVDFTGAATWMDGIKATGLEFFSGYHFVDQYYVRGKTDEIPKFEDNNVVWAIHQSIETLTDKKSSVFSRALALRFLIHTVGDVHQPLHAASLVSENFPQGDRGGNIFHIKPTGEAEKYTNLHALWDSGVLYLPDVKANSENSREIIKKTADELIKSIPSSSIKDKIAIQDPWIWAQESFVAAKNHAYGNLSPGDVIPQTYIIEGQKTAKERLALAGYRLADLLNRVVVRSDSPVRNSDYISLEELVNSLPKVKITAGFDIDGTILFSSPGYYYGLTNHDGPNGTNKYGEHPETSDVLWGQMNASFDRFSIPKSTGRLLIERHKMRGDNIVIITARPEINASALKDHLFVKFDLPKDTKILFTGGGSKTQLIKEHHVQIYYGDSDSDIKQARMANVRAVRFLRSELCVDPVRATPGMYGEEILQNSNY